MMRRRRSRWSAVGEASPRLPETLVTAPQSRTGSRPASSWGSGGRAGGREPHREVLDAADEVGAQPVGLAEGLEAGYPPRQLLEQHPDLQPGELRAQAEVGPAAAEGDVRVGIAGDVEAERVVEHGLVAVAGDVPEADLLAGADHLPAQLEVPGGVAAEEHDRRRPPQDLLDGAVDVRRRVGHQQ